MSNDFQASTEPKAKKYYLCHMCGEQIVPGMVHVKWAGVFEGDFHSTRGHLECMEAVKKWDADDWDYFERHTLVRGENKLK